MLPDPIRRAFLACAEALPASMDANQRVRTTAALVAWKRLDDQFEEEVRRRRGWGCPDPANIHWHNFIVPPHARFEVADDAQTAYRQIGAWNPCLRGHVDVMAPNVSGRALDAARAHLLSLDFRDAALHSPDIVGMAYELVRYEYLRPKNVLGEFFSPPNLCELSVQMNPPKRGHHVSDPAAGSGRKLQHAAWFVRRARAESNPLVELYHPYPPPLLLVAQEIQPFLASMCQFNLLALGYTNAICLARDSLLYPVLTAEVFNILNERDLAMASLRILSSRPDPDRPELEIAPRAFIQVDRGSASPTSKAEADTTATPQRRGTKTSLFDDEGHS